MVKNIIRAFVASFAVVFSASAQVVAEDTVAVTDFGYAQAVHARTANYDYRSVVLDNGQKVLLETAPNSGMEIGALVGVDYFNDVVTPIAGMEIGYHGKRFSVSGNASFGYSEYNKESQRKGDKYLTTNFGADLGVRLFDLPSKYLHQKEVWLIGSFGYKVRKNYNVYSAETETDYSNLKMEVKGSTMTYGAGIRVDFKNYMKKSNLYVKAMVYTGQEYFADGSRERIGASVTLGFNFVMGRKAYNEGAIKSLFGSKAAYKRALKAKKVIANY